MTPDEQDRLTTNIAKKMESVTLPVKERQLVHFYRPTRSTKSWSRRNSACR
jgi:hypothetical protein